MNTPRLRYHMTVLLGSVLLAACGTDPEEEPLTKDEALALYEGIGKTAEGLDAELFETDKTTIRCSGVGTITFFATVEVRIHGDTVSARRDATTVPSGCKLATTPVIVIEGDPEIRSQFAAMWVVEEGEVEEADVVGESVTGGVKWKLGERSGTCAIDLKSSFDGAFEDFEDWTPTYAGKLCGHDVEVEFEPSQPPSK